MIATYYRFILQPSKSTKAMTVTYDTCETYKKTRKAYYKTDMKDET